MSNLYIYEPATNGKVVIHTTVGDIEVELWSKEAPKACRNFLALIMEGYYDNCIFHRIVANFIIQTGDPTGTGHGGESFYGEPFEDEPHQRLKFSRRGLVAMANDNVRNSNRSQFFITLDRTDSLQNKHTIFGKVSAEGNTIFNVLKIGQSEVDGDERPVYPIKIKSVEILDNPFDDIVPRITAAERRRQLERKRESAREQREREERKKVKKKNTKVLSFGDEAEEEEAEATREKKSLIRPDMDASAPESIPSFESLAPPPSAPSASASQSKPRREARDEREDEELDLSKVRAKKAEELETPAAKRAKEIEKMEANLRKLSRPRSGTPDSDSDDGGASKRAKTGPSVLEAELAAYTRGRAKGKSKAKDDSDVLAALGLFTKKMAGAPAEKDSESKREGADAEEEEAEGLDVDDDLGWMGHRLVEVRAEKDAEVSRRAEADYEVIDTRKDKGRGHLEPGRGGGGVHRGPPSRRDRDDRSGGGREGGYGQPRSRTAYNVGRGGRGGANGGGGGGGGRRGWD